MKKEMLINVLQPEETRIAILEDGILEELYVERVSNEGYVGNIYKGRVVNIEPSIQAAFIDFGVGRNGFLHISDIDPQYFGDQPSGGGERNERGGRDRGERGDRGGDRGERGGQRGGRGQRQQRPPRAPEGVEGVQDHGSEEAPRAPRPQTGGERREGADRGPRGGAGERGGQGGGERGGQGGGDRDSARRGGRRRRGRGRGRTEERPVTDDLPDELTMGSDSLPELEDLKFDEELNELAVQPRAPEEEPTPDEPKVEEPKREEPRRVESRRPEPRRVERPIPPPEPVPEPEPVEESDDGGFGDGLFDDEPPAQPQRGVYRRTEPGDDDGFGEGIFEDEPSAPPAPRVEPAARERHAAVEPEEHELGPEPREERYDDEEHEVDNWSEIDHEIDASKEDPLTADVDVPPEEMGPRDQAAPSSGEEGTPEEQQARRRRRRRRGGRGRRGRSKEDQAAEEGGAPAEGEGEGEIPPFEPEHPESEVRKPAPVVDDEMDDEEDALEELDDRGRPDPRRRSSNRNGDRRGGRPNGRTMYRDPRRPRERPPIQSILKRGQEVLVQVIKEGIGNKGPTLSTYISIPGRYLVLMPGLNRVGVSRKIVDEDQRRRLKEIVAELERPDGVGFIIRTAGLERTKKELERDLAYLIRLWEVVTKRIGATKAPACIYQESDMIIRTIRDIFTSEIDTIYIDEPEAFERAKEFLQIVMPKYVDRLQLYAKPEPLFHHFGIEHEIAKIQQREVPLPHGGSIVIDQTEALVAIDVNSGNFRTDGDAEETAYRINLHAAKEISRQLRLRDLGGVIVNDFIDMREERHRRAVENAMRDNVQRDRARTKILRMSAFGIIEMTRQRIRPSLRRSLYRECPVCRGHGQIKTIETMAIDCMRLLSFVGQRGDVKRIQLTLQSEVASYLQNKKRKQLGEIEQKWDLMLQITGKELRSPEDMSLVCYNATGDVLKVELDIPNSDES